MWVRFSFLHPMLLMGARCARVVKKKTSLAIRLSFTCVLFRFSMHPLFHKIQKTKKKKNRAKNKKAVRSNFGLWGQENAACSGSRRLHRMHLLALLTTLWPVGVARQRDGQRSSPHRPEEKTARAGGPCETEKLRPEPADFGPLYARLKPVIAKE